MKFLILMIAVFCLMGSAVITTENKYPEPLPIICTQPDTARTNLIWMIGQVANGYYSKGSGYNTISSGSSNTISVPSPHAIYGDKETIAHIVKVAKDLLKEAGKNAK